MKLSKLILAVLGATVMSAGAWAQSSRDLVIISPIDVKPGKEAECIASWDKAAMVLREKPGFKSARLHRANASDARSNLVTVAAWANFEQYEAAVADPQFRAAFATEACSPNSSPYRAVREIRGSAGRPGNPTDSGFSMYGGSN